MTLEDGPVAVSKVRVLSRHRSGARERAIVELVIHEGRNRIVRRLLAEVGHPVKRLTRTRIGPGRHRAAAHRQLRELTSVEIGDLLDAASL